MTRVKEKSFCFRRASFERSVIRTVFVTALMMMFTTYISTVSGAVIVGRIVGENGLCATNLVSPLFNYATFLSGMIGVGSALLYFRYLGASQKDRADEIFSQSVILALLAGLLLLAVMTFGEDAFLDRLKIPDTVRVEAEAFWKFEKYFIALLPIDFLLYELLYTDTRTTAAANITQIGGDILASVICTRRYGTMGASLGTLIGEILSLLIFCTHFLGKRIFLPSSGTFPEKMCWRCFACPWWIPARTWILAC